MFRFPTFFFFFFFNDTATTEIYTLSLHDALPISTTHRVADPASLAHRPRSPERKYHPLDRKSTRLNSSHGYISYAVFCLKKKKREQHDKKPPVGCDAEYSPDQPGQSEVHQQRRHH